MCAGDGRLVQTGALSTACRGSASHCLRWKFADGGSAWRCERLLQALAWGGESQVQGLAPPRGKNIEERRKNYSWHLGQFRGSYSNKCACFCLSMPFRALVRLRTPRRHRKICQCQPGFTGLCPQRLQQCTSSLSILIWKRSPQWFKQEVYPTTALVRMIEHSLVMQPCWKHHSVCRMSLA